MGLAVTLVSLVSVAIFVQLGGATFDETLRQVRSALALVREDARLAGEPLRLVARDADDRVELVALPLDAEVADPFATDPIEGRGSAADEIDTGRIAFAEDEGERSSFDERASGRVYLTLARGYRLERLTPEQREAAILAMESGERAGEPEGRESPGGPDALLPMGSDGSAGSDGPLTIGVFLPDGSVITGEPPVLRAPSGAMVEVRINPWTGRVVLEPLRPEVPSAEEEPEEEEFEPLAEDPETPEEGGP